MAYTSFIFDNDGVLVDTTELQVEATQLALREILSLTLDTQEDISILKSTVTTRDKLIKLCHKGYFTLDKVDAIYERKKAITDKMMSMLDSKDYQDKIEMFEFLRQENKNIAIVTNANRTTTTTLLNRLGFMKYLDVLITNNDVQNTKPHAEPYIRAMLQLGGAIEDFVIFEDSITGLASARGTGAAVYEISNFKDVNARLMKKIIGGNDR